MEPLRRLIDIQEELGIAVARHYRTGLSEDKISALEREHQFVLPLDVRAAYRHRNGAMGERSTPMVKLWILPGFYWLDLEEALCTRRELRSEPEMNWKDEWLPILSSGGASFLVSESFTGRIVLFEPESTLHEKVIFSSLGEMFARTTDGLRQGLLFVDEAGVSSAGPEFWNLENDAQG